LADVVETVDPLPAWDLAGVEGVEGRRPFLRLGRRVGGGDVALGDGRFDIMLEGLCGSGTAGALRSRPEDVLGYLSPRSR
jgi:hypothetical protein